LGKVSCPFIHGLNLSHHKDLQEISKCAQRRPCSKLEFPAVSPLREGVISFLKRMSFHYGRIFCILIFCSWSKFFHSLQILVVEREKNFSAASLHRVTPLDKQIGGIRPVLGYCLAQ